MESTTKPGKGLLARFAKCHPDRYERSRGLCRPCYHKACRAYPFDGQKRRKLPPELIAAALAGNLPQRVSAHPKDRAQEKAKTTAAAARMAYRLKKKFGLRSVDYDHLLRQQKGLCAICGSPAGRRRLPVDHDHFADDVREPAIRRKAIRGLLCQSCNAGVGMFRDDPVLLIRAAEYLWGHFAVHHAGCFGALPADRAGQPTDAVLTEQEDGGSSDDSGQ